MQSDLIQPRTTSTFKFKLKRRLDKMEAALKTTPSRNNIELVDMKRVYKWLRLKALDRSGVCQPLHCTGCKDVYVIVSIITGGLALRRLSCPAQLLTGVGVEVPRYSNLPINLRHSSIVRCY